jgi:hypothetical protein
MDDIYDSSPESKPKPKRKGKQPLYSVDDSEDGESTLMSFLNVTVHMLSNEQSWSLLYLSFMRHLNTSRSSYRWYLRQLSWLKAKTKTKARQEITLLH